MEIRLHLLLTCLLALFIGSYTAVQLKNPIGTYNYGEALEKSMYFYWAQRSGRLPSPPLVPWRGDSAAGDSTEDGKDLTGGWYDAGDGVKFNFPMAWSVTNLAWGGILFQDGYTKAGQLNSLLDNLKWALTYLKKCYVNNEKYYAQVGDPDLDHSFWGKPEDMKMPRPSYFVDASRPGADVVGETAAAFAASAVLFRQTGDQDTYKDLLTTAKSLFQFAQRYPGKYSDAIPKAKVFYESTDYTDEIAWAAAWLYYATSDASYKSVVDGFSRGYEGWAYSWDDKKPGIWVLMSHLTEGTDQAYRSLAEKYLKNWLPGGDVTYTPKGLAWRLKWGSNRYAANSAFLAVAYNSLLTKIGQPNDDYLNFAANQLHYFLGDTGRSFVVGFGNNPPVRPHHRGASCPPSGQDCSFMESSSEPNKNILYGALVGGPDQNDNYNDVRTDYVANEVATDYNSGYSGILAAMTSRSQSSSSSSVSTPSPTYAPVPTFTPTCTCQRRKRRSGERKKRSNRRSSRHSHHHHSHHSHSHSYSHSRD